MIDGVILPALLALIMFGVGLDMRPSAFVDGMVSARSLLAGLVGVGIVVPVGSLTIATLVTLDPALTTGLILLAISPVGLLASPLTGHANGNIALALALTIIVSLAYIILAPVLIASVLMADHAMPSSIRIPADLLFGKIVIVTLLPAAIGATLNAWRSDCASRLSRAIAHLTRPALVVVLSWIAFDNRAALLQTPAQLLATIVAMNVFSVAVAAFLGKLARLNQADRSALLFAHLMRQEGTGIFVAVSILAIPAAAVPLIANTVIGLGFCGIVWILRVFRGGATRRGALARQRSVNPA